jgi:hypothetical protein
MRRAVSRLTLHLLANLSRKLHLGFALVRCRPCWARGKRGSSSSENSRQRLLELDRGHYPLQAACTQVHN